MHLSYRTPCTFTWHYPMSSTTGLSGSKFRLLTVKGPQWVDSLPHFVWRRLQALAGVLTCHRLNLSVAPKTTLARRRKRMQVVSVVIVIGFLHPGDHHMLTISYACCVSVTPSPATGSSNLWVSGLASTTRATDLKTLFSKHGKVSSTDGCI